MIIIYIPCSSITEAQKIGEHLLSKRLCACIAIIPQIQSLYYWPPKKDKIEKAKEAVLLVKTIKSKFNQIEKEVTKIHSYKVPCIFSIKIDDVNQPYLEWLKGEVDK